MHVTNYDNLRSQASYPAELEDAGADKVFWPGAFFTGYRIKFLGGISGKVALDGTYGWHVYLGMAPLQS